MKHKKEIILVLIGVILILVGAYLTSRISVKEKTEKNKNIGKYDFGLS